jgi:putative tricarboxylic transport membrane protein
LNDPRNPTVATRWPELLVALGLMGLGAVVVFDSLRVGAGWGDDGPRSGYFPFYIGCALVVSSAWTALGALRRWKQTEVFVERAQLESVLAILGPMVVYVALIKPLGIYLASALLIAWFMFRHGAHRWWITALVAVGVPLLFFAVFERWFLVPLPKGPLEALFGF